MKYIVLSFLIIMFLPHLLDILQDNRKANEFLIDVKENQTGMFYSKEVRKIQIMLNTILEINKENDNADKNWENIYTIWEDGYFGRETWALLHMIITAYDDIVDNHSFIYVQFNYYHLTTKFEDLVKISNALLAIIEFEKGEQYGKNNDRIYATR